MIQSCDLPVRELRSRGSIWSKVLFFVELTEIYLMKEMGEIGWWTVARPGACSSFSKVLVLIAHERSKSAEAVI